MGSLHTRRSLVVRAVVTAALIFSSLPAYAQLDPLLFLKRSQPNILVMVDAGNRMQRDAPTDPANPVATSSYYDPYVYTRGTNISAETTLGVTALNTTLTYRRKYNNFALSSNTNPDRGTTTNIAVVRDRDPGFLSFDAPTRLALVRAALYRSIQANQGVARFGLYKMRQNTPTLAAERSGGTVVDSDPSQTTPAITEASSGKWYIARPTVSAKNGSTTAVTGNPNLVKADAANANTNILSILAKDAHTSGGLLPAGQDDKDTVDEPVQYMIDDLKTEAQRLITADATEAQCRNTVAILLTGGGEGTTVSGADPVTAASTFMTAFAGRRVPIIVIAIAPPTADIANLQLIASKSGGQYFEITKSQIDAALASTIQATTSGTMTGTVVVPELARALNIGIQTAFQNFDDLNTKPVWTGTWTGFKGYPGSATIPSSEFQVTSPIIGTVNLTNAKDITGAPLPLTVVNDKAGALIPQRSNLMVTAAFAMPGFDAVLRGFRMYKPEADPSQPSGYKFKADGTPLWVASAPDPASRNLYTALPDGTMVAFTTANAATLAPYMNLSVADATAVITSIRNQPIGPIVDSTPAVMNAPSLDPPPDATYPGFASSLKNRRTVIFFGTNNGIMEGIDARLGQEVWGFIPFNLLPKLRVPREGHSVGGFTYMADGSPKVADVKLADGTWHTYLFVGEGPGGTFYQTLDVTMSTVSVAPDSDSITDLLTAFSSPTVIPLKWTYPLYSSFDYTLSTTTMPYGDLKSSATAAEKTVGQTWSDPAVGQVEASSSPYVMLTGSGFLPYSTQQQTNRKPAVAGTTFYIFKVDDGTLLDSRDAGNDGLAEDIDNCVTAKDCSKQKNALQSDPVATGPSDSRFITKSYMGDLDAQVWRFDIALDTALKPYIKDLVKLYYAAANHPIFSSMATVNVGSTQQYLFFGTGSDLLPSVGVSTPYQLVGVLDQGSTGAQAFSFDLVKVDGIGSDEKVTTFPAVAGDIVFFTTTTLNPTTPCTAPTAALYALTFIGGPAYDTDNDGKFDNKDSTQVTTIAGKRATAPFIVDQHLVFGVGGDVQVFGDPADFNNGIGQAGVRILSWREVR